VEKRTAGELVTSIRAGTPPPDSDVADARREVAEAQERIEASRAILPTLDEACRESESAAIAAEARLARFADAVITAEVPLHEMFSEIERMQVALNEKRWRCVSSFSKT
jgi:hypothetical protein